MGSVVAVPGLRNTGSVVVPTGLVARVMWDPPGPAMEPVSHCIWQADSLPPGHHENPQPSLLIGKMKIKSTIIGSSHRGISLLVGMWSIRNFHSLTPLLGICAKKIGC